MKTYNLKLAILLLITLCCADLVGTAYLVQWREAFWSSVSDKNLTSFIKLLMIFSVVALTLCVVNGLQTYVRQHIALYARKKLTKRALATTRARTLEGHQQRIQEDCRDYPLLALDLLQYVVMQSILVVYFIYVIAHQAGIVYVMIPIAYGLIGTGLGYYIANPLIHLNYVNQVLEAAFRQSLSKLDYGKVHRNNHKMFRKTKHLQYFQYFYTQTSVIFPYLILAPLYFSGVIVFGVLMQCASTIAHLTDALGSIVTNFDKVNKMLSCRKRLIEMGVI